MPEKPKSVARGSMFGMSGQIWYLITVLLLYAYLGRQFGPATFGRWRVVFSILVWLELFVDSGLTKTTSKRIAEGNDDLGLVMRGSYAMQAVVSLIMFGCALLLAWPVSLALGDTSLAPLIRIAALDIPLYAAFSMSRSMLAGMRRFEHQAVGMFVYPLAKLVFIAGLVHGGWSVAGALAGNALASVAGFAATVVPWNRITDFDRKWQDVSQQLGFAAVPFLVFGLMDAFPASVDLWSVKALMRSNIAAGFYGAASGLAQTPILMFSGLFVILFPSIAKVNAEGDTRLVSQYAQQAMRLVLLITCLGIALTVSTGRQVLALVYSAPFAAAYVPLVLLVVGASLRTVWATCAEIMLARSRQTEALGLLAVMLVAELVALAVLIPRLGLIGAALSVTVSAGVIAAVGVFRLRRLFGMRPLKTLVRAGAAAGVVGVGINAMSVPVPWLPFAWLAGAAVYLALLLIMREANSDDVASIRQVFARERA